MGRIARKSCTGRVRISQRVEAACRGEQAWVECGQDLARLRIGPSKMIRVRVTELVPQVLASRGKKTLP